MSWPLLLEERPDFQFDVVDCDNVIARVRSLPVPWDGTVADLPVGR
jgi:hypothetical protein